MDPQEGDIADLPDGRTVVFQGGRWVVQGGGQSAPQGQPGIPGFVPMETPADRRAAETAQRADQRLSLAEETAARQARAEERRVAMEGQTQDRQGVQSESDLRREFLGLPAVKEFQTIAASYRNVVATANNDSAAGDLSLIFSFMKILDPNSVVREQEFANAQNAAGYPDIIRNALNRINTGERLSERQRADFVAQARSVYDNRAATFNETATFYQGLAGQYGYKPENVANPVEIDTAPVSVNQQTITEEEANNPNLLSAQGYRYDGGTDTWVRDENAAQVADTRSQETGIGRRADTFVRGIADGVTFGLADEISAGLNTVLPLDRGTVSGFGQGGFRQAYDSNLAAVRGVDATDAQQMPLTRGAGQLVGAVAAPGSMASGRYIAAAPSMLSAAGRGAGVGAMAGAAYGAGSAEGPIESRLQGAQAGAMTGAVAGGALSAGGRAVGGAIDGAMGRMMTSPRAQAVQTLRDNGVSLTPGQSLGGIAKNAEDLGQRFPIVGPAIRGARERSRDSLNRAVGNRALDNIGEGVPADVNVGGDMVSHVRDRLGSEFDRAYSMVPEINPNDPALLEGMARIGQSKADLPPAMQQQFDSIVSERLARLQGATTGQNVGAVRSELNTLASGYLRSQDPAQQALGGMIAELGDELDGAISRASPEAGQILSQAREGYADYIRLERASTNAGGEAFAPGQLRSAVKASDGTVRHGGIGRGQARMQDLSRAASAVMPDSFGNPGSADAGLLVGLGALTSSNPVAGGATVMGLGAAATPYLMMGRRVVERLPANASRRELEAAAKELDGLAAQDSNVISLRDEIARRIGQTVPAVAQQTVPERRLMTGSR